MLFVRTVKVFGLLIIHISIILARRHRHTPLPSLALSRGRQSLHGQRIIGQSAIIDGSRPPLSASRGKRPGWDRLRGGYVPENIESSVLERDMVEARNTDIDNVKELAPFEPGRPLIFEVIDHRTEELLAKGETWQSTQLIGNTVVGQAVMDVEAPPSIVWKQLMDFDSYTRKVKLLRKSFFYRGLASPEGDYIQQMFVKFVSGLMPGIELTYNVVHTIDPSKNSMTWELDDEQNNDFKELQGHWHIEEHPEDPSKSRVFYEIGLVTPSWLPRSAMKKLAKWAMNDATSWVKRESKLEEEGPKKLVPFEPGRPLIFSVIDKRTEGMLARGETWKSVRMAGNTALGQAALDIAAPHETVWKQLFDVDSYAKKAPMIKTSQLYKGIAAEDGTYFQHLLVRFESSVVPGLTLQFHIRYTFDPANGSITWELDDEKKNDLSEIQGHWHVERHPEDVSRTRGFYEIGLVCPWWLPKGVMEELTTWIVSGATSWVKKESEQAALSEVERKDSS